MVCGKGGGGAGCDGGGCGVCGGGGSGNNCRSAIVKVVMVLLVTASIWVAVEF